MAAITRMHGETIAVTQLYYARAAADLGSFSRAAASLGVTQPALSHGIAALEQALGGALFRRSTTGVALTPLGARLLPHLHALLGGLDALLTEARTATGQDAEPLRMGVSPLIHPALVARAFQAARQHAPAALILREDNLADLRAALLARQLDLIVVPAVTAAEGCDRHPLDREPLHYIPSSGATRGEPGTPVEVADLAGQPLVMVGDACGLTTFTRALFTGTGTGTELRAYPGEADSYRTLEDWARLGLGGTLLPLSRIRDPADARPVHHHGRPVESQYEALWLTRSHRQAAIRALLDALPSPA
jgi:DNA-binding transcriptional LysR family regulator